MSNLVPLKKLKRVLESTPLNAFMRLDENCNVFQYEDDGPTDAGPSLPGRVAADSSLGHAEKTEGPDDPDSRGGTHHRRRRPPHPVRPRLALPGSRRQLPG